MNAKETNQQTIYERLNPLPRIERDTPAAPSTGSSDRQDTLGQPPNQPESVARGRRTPSPSHPTTTRSSEVRSRRSAASRGKLGEILQARRHVLGLTQRELAARLGVKAAHVAYLETARRRPSLGLLRRIADVLGLDREKLFTLAHPEASGLFRPKQVPKVPAREGVAWTEFRRNRPLLMQHQIKSRELKVLSQVNLLGKISSPRSFLFILNAIRQAVDEE